MAFKNKRIFPRSHAKVHEETASTADAPKSYAFHGKVESVNAAEGLFKVYGDRIDGWMEAMSMDYRVDDPAVLKAAKPGDRINATVYDGDIAMLHKVQVVRAQSK